MAIHCAQGQAWTLLALPLYCDDSYGIAWLCCLLLACTGEGSPGPFVASTSALASLVRAFIPGAPFSPWSRTRSSVFFRCSLPLLTSHKSVSSCILVSCLLVSFFFISSPCFSPLMGAELFPQPAKFSPSPILTKSLGKEILVCQKYMLSIRKFLVGSEQPGGQQGHLRGSSLSHASVGGFASLPPPTPVCVHLPRSLARSASDRSGHGWQEGTFSAGWQLSCHLGSRRGSWGYGADSEDQRTFQVGRIAGLLCGQGIFLSVGHGTRLGKEIDLHLMSCKY